MSTALTRMRSTVDRLVRSREMRHDLTLFAGCAVATGVVSAFTSGAPRDVLIAAIVAAGRRFLVKRLGA